MTTALKEITDVMTINVIIYVLVHKMFPYFGWTATTNHVDSEGGGGLLKNLSVHKGGGGVRHKIALKFAKNRKNAIARRRLNSSTDLP